MVRKIEMSDNLIVTAEVVAQRLVIGYSGEQDKSLGIKITRVSFGEDCL